MRSGFNIMRKCTRYGWILGAAALWAGTATVHAAAPDGYLDASTFSAGFNPIDATAALQDAIHTGQNVYVPNMGVPWVVTPIILDNSNQTILFEDGVVVQAKPGAYRGPTDSLFRAVNVQNVTLIGYGATFEMHKSDYSQPPYDVDARRSGISLYTVDNFQIKGLKIQDTGGDGILITGWPNETSSKNVLIQDVVLKNNYRQGVSVMGVDGLTIDNAVMIDTKMDAPGAPLQPQAGIDFEPYTVGQVLKNIVIKNSIFANNAGSGIMFDLNYGDPNITTATIENVTIFNNGYDNSDGLKQGISLRETIPGLTIKDSLIVNNAGYGAYSWLRTGSSIDGVDYSALLGNGSGAFHWNGNMAAGAGTLTSLSGPLFYSTDPDSPYFMYLDPEVSALISQGASDGGYMGARPVFSNVPEPAGAVMMLMGVAVAMGYRLPRTDRVMNRQ